MYHHTRILQQGVQVLPLGWRINNILFKGVRGEERKAEKTNRDNAHHRQHAREDIQRQLT